MRKRRDHAGILKSTDHVVLDSGGLSVMLGHSASARSWLEWCLAYVGTVVVPAPILVETITGHSGRDAETNRVLRALARNGRTSPVDEDLGRLAGKLRYRVGADDGIDALVAAEAAHTKQPCVVLTSDPGDLTALLADQPQVTIRPV
ncbi:MAG: PIN domain-containing protein [Egibacteraceae bacterium]